MKPSEDMTQPEHHSVQSEAAFVAQAERVGASVQRVSRGELSAHLVEFLKDVGCRTVALADPVAQWGPMVRALSEAGLTIESTRELRPTRRADAGVSLAKLGVAETDSTLLHSTAEDRRVELCVDVHVVLLDVPTVVPTLDSAFAALRDIAAHPLLHLPIRASNSAVSPKGGQRRPDDER
jgi:L-lactate utilization protein LutC